MKIEIKNRWTGTIIFGGDFSCVAAAVMAAINSRANLSRAYLSRADLSGANLSGAKGAELAVASTRILPEGDLIAWKLCRDKVLVKLLVPAEARRSSAFGRKCRAEYVKVLEVIGATEGVSIYTEKIVYKTGKTVKPLENFCDDYTQECASGIHFFITRLEAENYKP